MKQFKDFLKEQPTNWTRSNASYAGFSADAPSPTASTRSKNFGIFNVTAFNNL